MMLRASHTSPYAPRPIGRSNSWSGTCGDLRGGGTLSSDIVEREVSADTLRPLGFKLLDFLFELIGNAVLGCIDLSFTYTERAGDFLDGPILGHIQIEDLQMLGVGPRFDTL